VELYFHSPKSLNDVVLSYPSIAYLPTFLTAHTFTDLLLYLIVINEQVGVVETAPPRYPTLTDFNLQHTYVLY